MSKPPTHRYVGNPGYLVRLEAHGVAQLEPGAEFTLTDAEAAAAGADFEAIAKPAPKTTSKTKPAADAADTKDDA